MRNFFPIMRFKIKLFQLYSKVKTVVLFAYDLNKAVICTSCNLHQYVLQKNKSKALLHSGNQLHTLDFQARMELRVY